MMLVLFCFFLLPFINKGQRQKAMERRPRTMIKVTFTAESSLFSSVWGCVCSPHERWLKLIWIADDKAAQSLLNKLIRSNLVNTTNQVEVLQRDPNSPLYSVKSFEELRLWVWLCSSFNRGQTSMKLFCGVYFSFFFLPGNLSYCKECMPWVSTGPPRSRRPRCPWCSQNRTFIITLFFP